MTDLPRPGETISVDLGESPEKIKLCKNCRHWAAKGNDNRRDGFAQCLNPRLATWCHPIPIRTAPVFGCVFFEDEAREMAEEIGVLVRDRWATTCEAPTAVEIERVIRAHQYKRQKERPE